MLFSDAFNIQRARRDDWFDPILDTDTPLFIDPFLIFKEQGHAWQATPREMVYEMTTSGSISI
jgi:hypothetical protein